MVGALNTLLSLAVIYLLMNFYSEYTANFWGYIVGVTNSFIWNKLWVFKKNKGEIHKEIISFLVIFAFCYGIQFASLYLMVKYFSVNSYIAQLLAMVVYTMMNFILNKCITFKG